MRLLEVLMTNAYATDSSKTPVGICQGRWKHPEAGNEWEMFPMEKHLGMATALWSLRVAEPVNCAVHINAWSLEIYYAILVLVQRGHNPLNVAGGICRATQLHLILIEAVA